MNDKCPVCFNNAYITCSCKGEKIPCDKCNGKGTRLLNPSKCSKCYGEGHIGWSSDICESICVQCGGKGWKNGEENDDDDNILVYYNCDKCNGKGEIECKKCRGDWKIKCMYDECPVK